MRQRFVILALMLLILVAVPIFAVDESVNALIQAIPLPAWIKGVLALILGGGIVGTAARFLFGKAVLKWLPWAAHALTIIKKFAKAVTKIRPILNDVYVVEKYGDLLSEYNAIIDELELLCNDAKITNKQDFLEKYKVEKIDHAKVLNAVRLSPVIAAANEELDQLDKEGK